MPGFDPEQSNLKRKLSKREKKELKKQEKERKARSRDSTAHDPSIGSNEASVTGKDGVAEKLYTEVPETSFTRSISNPEAVMRRRRQQKLEKKLQQLCQEGGPEAGGTLRIFGETLNKDVPYKTLLLSTRDTAASVVSEILEKYGKDKEESGQYCLVQLVIPHGVTSGATAAALDCSNSNASDNTFNNNNHHQQLNSALSNPGIREYILDDDDCPLAIEKQHLRSRGTLSFHIRRRPADFQPRKKKKKPLHLQGKPTDFEVNSEELLERLHSLQPTSSSSNNGCSIPCSTPGCASLHPPLFPVNGSANATLASNSTTTTTVNNSSHNQLLHQNHNHHPSSHLNNNMNNGNIMSNHHHNQALHSDSVVVRRSTSTDTDPILQQQHPHPSSKYAYGVNEERSNSASTASNSQYGPSDEVTANLDLIQPTSAGPTSATSMTNQQPHFFPYSATSSSDASQLQLQQQQMQLHHQHQRRSGSDEGSSSQGNNNVASVVAMNGPPAVKGAPEVKVYLLHKTNNGMGLSIVATKGIGQDQLGIYVKTVVPGGAADAVCIFIMYILSSFMAGSLHLSCSFIIMLS